MHGIVRKKLKKLQNKENPIKGAKAAKSDSSSSSSSSSSSLSEATQARLRKDDLFPAFLLLWTYACALEFQAKSWI